MEHAHSARIIVSPAALAGGPADVDAVIGACAPDIRAGPEGTVTTLAREGDTLVMEIRAQDTASFRAALNAHLKCLSLAAEVSSRAVPDE